MLTILVSALTLLLLLIAFVVIFRTFQKRKIEILLEKNRIEAEAQRSMNEITEGILKNLAWELHDNICQLLSIVNIELNLYQLKNEEDQKLIECNEIVSKCIEQIRGLSRSLNTQNIKSKGLITSVKGEVERLNRLEIIKADLNVTGKTTGIGGEIEIIVFRMIQEFISNTLRHSGADTLNVHLHFSSKTLSITVTDNGKGFSTDNGSDYAGSGIITMQERAKMIGADLNINSDIGKGTTLEMELVLENRS